MHKNFKRIKFEDEYDFINLSNEFEINKIVKGILVGMNSKFHVDLDKIAKESMYKNEFNR